MDSDEDTVEAITRLFRANHSIGINPIAQARHRMHGGRIYDPSGREKIIFKLLIIDYLREKYGITVDMMPLTASYVSVNVTFLIRRPICHFVGGDRNGSIREQYVNAMPTTLGDIDNYVKFFLDAIEGVFYGNDRNVVQVRAIKLYCNGNNGRVKFSIRPFEIVTIDDEN